MKPWTLANPSCYPVHLFKLYNDKRPPETLKDDLAFSLNPVHTSFGQNLFNNARDKKEAEIDAPKM